MRKMFLAAAIIATASVAGGLAYADPAPAVPSTPPAATAGWFNAELQTNSEGIISQRPTTRVEHAMRDNHPVIVLAASARSPQWQA